MADDRLHSCGGTFSQRIKSPPPPDPENWSWGCTPTGTFKCDWCGVMKKFRLRDGEKKDNAL
jgi:hypothetical protein